MAFLFCENMYYIEISFNINKLSYYCRNCGNRDESGYRKYNLKD